MATNSNPYNRGGPGKPRNSTWISGPDPIVHDKFNKWHKHRSQAHFRQEPYELSFEDWLAIWSNNDEWFSRGTAVESLCLTMKDIDLGWRKDNVEIITRAEQLYRHGLRRIGMKKDGPGSLNPRLRK